MECEMLGFARRAKEHAIWTVVWCMVSCDSEAHRPVMAVGRRKRICFQIMESEEVLYQDDIRWVVDWTFDGEQGTA
jgi:hypothetical protein